MNDSDLDLLATKVMGWKRRNAAWRPDEEIEQAFEVIEKLESEGAEVIIYKTKTMIFYKGYWHQGLGGIRPEHMMKAALKAVESTE